MITVLEVLRAYGSDDYFSVEELLAKFPHVDAADLKTLLVQADEQGLLSLLRANGAVEKLTSDQKRFYEITIAGREAVFKEMTRSTGKVARDILSELGNAS